MASRPAFASRTGSNQTSTNSSTSLAVTVTVNAGDTVIVAVATENTNITAPTDNASGGSNVYQQMTARITNTVSIQLWICVNAKAATTVTANYSASRASACVACYTGGTGFVRADSSSTGSGANPSFTSTQDAADSLIIAAFAVQSTGTFTAGTGNLRVSIAGGGTTTPGCAIVDNSGTPGTAITTSVTHVAIAWAAVAKNVGVETLVPGADVSGMMAGANAVFSQIGVGAL